MKILLVLSLLFSANAFAEPNKVYQFIAASQTDASLGPNGKVGDVIERLMIVPETTSAGTVSIKDGNGNAAAYKTNVFVAGTLADLHPIIVELGATSISADWSVTTGSAVHVIAIGAFH